MSWTVTHVSRGDIHLEDGAKQARVLGEGLLASEPNAPSFIVYLNSLEILKNDETESKMDETTRQRIIEAIKEHFLKRETSVAFE